MAAAGLAVSITAQFFAAKASVGFATELRQAVYDHVQKLSYTELDTLGTDTLITRLTDDINQVQNGVNMGLRLLLRSPFYCIGFHGHGLYDQHTLCIDLCCCYSGAFPGCICDYVPEYSAFWQGTGTSGRSYRTNP